MNWSWWIRNILHLETLFMIVISIAVIYFVFFYRPDRKKTKKTTIPLDFIESVYQPKKTKKSKKKPRKNQHEERCREIFESIFHTRFRSTRPDWLKNPVTGENLELDGFNSSIPTPMGKGLAFEYDGEQHSRYVRHFHRNGPREFEYQTKKDAWKDLRCKDVGVLLIRIPHFVGYHDLERYIKQKLRRSGMDDWVVRYDRGETRGIYD